MYSRAIQEIVIFLLNSYKVLKWKKNLGFLSLPTESKLLKTYSALDFYSHHLFT